MRLQDAPLGSAVQIGSFNYIKIADNKYMQSSAVVCPHGAKVGSQWVRCVNSEEEVVSTPCDINAARDGDECVCLDGYVTNINGDTTYTDNDGACGYITANDEMSYRGCDGFISGGFCWEKTITKSVRWASSTSATVTEIVCPSGEEWSVPTHAQIKTFLNIIGDRNMQELWGLSGFTRIWQATACTGDDSDKARSLELYSDGTTSRFHCMMKTAGWNNVRCIRNI